MVCCEILQIMPTIYSVCVSECSVLEILSIFIFKEVFIYLCADVYMRCMQMYSSNDLV